VTCDILKSSAHKNDPPQQQQQQRQLEALNIVSTAPQLEICFCFFQKRKVQLSRAKTNNSIVMPVTTRRQSRGVAQPNAMVEDERIRSLSANLGEFDDDGDPMDGPLGELSSSEVDDNGEDDEHVSSLSECEESDSSEFGGGMYLALLAYSSAHHTNCVCNQQQRLRPPWQSAAS
jgi:hypothetical protein